MNCQVIFLQRPISFKRQNHLGRGVCKIIRRYAYKTRSFFQHINHSFEHIDNYKVDFLYKSTIFSAVINPKIREDVLHGWDGEAYEAP